MIATTIVAEVRRLLNEGRLSQRKIAQLTGISRGSVVAIASGARPDYPAQFPSPDDDVEEPTGPPARCPGCGGLVYLPCRLCQVRKAIAKSARPARHRPTEQSAEPLGLNLRPDHRTRYEEVRAWRNNDEYQVRSTE